MEIFDLEVLKKDYYENYDPTVNPTIANAFSTAAYRFGHSLVQRSFVRFDSDHRPLFNSKRDFFSAYCDFQDDLSKILLATNYIEYCRNLSATFGWLSSSTRIIFSLQLTS